MTRTWKYILAAVSAGALVGSAASTAFAGRPGAAGVALRGQAPTQLSVGGGLNVGGTAKFNGNVNVAKKYLYAHGGAQVWNVLTDHGSLTVQNGETIQKGGLNVQAGGTNTDTLVVGASMKAADAEITGNLASGPINSTGPITGTAFTAAGSGSTGGSLTLTNGTNNVTLTNTGNSTLSTTGTISAGGLTTSGSFSAGTLSTTGQFTAGSIVDNGTLQASAIAASGAIQGQSLTTTGAIQGSAVTAGTISATNTVTANTANLTTLKVTGGVDFTNATVTGLSLNNLTGTLSSLTIGATSGTTPPLAVQENGQTAQVGVNGSGALTVSNLNVGSGLTVGGALTLTGGLTLPGTTAATGLVASQISGPGSSPGALSINSNSLTLNAPTSALNTLTLSSGSNLALTASGTSASHIVANGDTDVAGTLTVPISGPGPWHVDSPAFSVTYSGAPDVVVTPTGSTASGDPGAIRYWVTTHTNGFTINVNGTTAQSNITFNYVVIGQ
jgi:hypothetical protein